jgi:hypothetical protein
MSETSSSGVLKRTVAAQGRRTVSEIACAVELIEGDVVPARRFGGSGGGRMVGGLIWGYTTDTVSKAHSCEGRDRKTDEFKNPR